MCSLRQVQLLVSDPCHHFLSRAMQLLHLQMNYWVKSTAINLLLSLCATMVSITDCTFDRTQVKESSCVCLRGLVVIVINRVGFYPTLTVHTLWRKTMYSLEKKPNFPYHVLISQRSAVHWRLCTAGLLALWQSGPSGPCREDTCFG